MPRYQSLFNINIRHAYFTGNVCPSLQFFPTDSSIKVMSNAGLIYKSGHGGIEVQADINNVETLMLFAKDSDEPFELQFKVYSTDAHFLNYTQAQALTHQEILFFEQKCDGKNETKTVKAHQGDWITANDAMPIASLTEKGLITNKDKFNPPYLIFSVVITDNAISIFDSELFVAPTFQANIQTNTSIWKYYVLGDETNPQLNIVDKTGEIFFESMGVENVGLNKQAMIFQSKTPLSLYERSAYNFQLINKTESFSKVLINRLPVAKVSQVNQKVIDGNAVSLSEIYINF